jgi:hypothetical protein
MASENRSVVFIMGALMAACLAGATFLCAQEFRASIRGEVVDTSGAPIPGAKATAVEISTQQQYSATAGADGVFNLLYLLPGKYTVTVEARGFRRKVYTSVSLASAQALDLNNITLTVGSVRQQVTVTSSPGLLNTTSASGGGVLDQTKVENIGSEGHAAWMDLYFTPGVEVDSNAPFQDTPRNNTSDLFKVNGAPIASNGFYINSAPVSDKGTWYFVPPEDSVSQMQSSNNTYNAQYGRAGGGFFNANVKSGTNSFHGDLFEYAENSALEANSFSDNLHGLPKIYNNENTFGGSVGGPIHKDKTFFFFSYQGFRQDYATPVTDSVPTVAMKAGDFSASGLTVYDPLTTYCSQTNASGACSTYSRTAFPNDTIPASRISPMGAAIMNYYPAPTAAGYSDNYTEPGRPYNFAYDQYLGRVDQEFSESTRLFAMYGFQRNYYAGYGNNFHNGAFSGPIETGDPMVGIVDLVHVFSPTLVGDMKVSFVRYPLYTVTGNDVADNVLASSLGFTMPFVPSTTHQGIVPEVAVTDFTGLFVNTENGTVANDYYFTGSLDQMKGQHSFHYGFEFFDVQSGAQGIPGEPNGTFSFSGDWTRQNPLSGTPNAAMPLSDLLLGYPTSGSVSWNLNPFITYHAYGAYLQDDYKVRRNITLNLGLRWDAYSSPAERFNGINGGFCFTCTNPDNALINHTAYPTLENPLTGGLTFAGVSAPSAPFNVQVANFQPRFGIAWSIKPKLVFRGGYGRYLNPGLVATTSTGFSETTSYVDSLNGGLTPTNYFLSGTPFPSGAVKPAGASGGLATDAGAAIAYDPPAQRAPITQQWSAGFQFALPKQIVLDIEYTGSHTAPIGVNTSVDNITPALEAQCFHNNATCNTLVSNPFYSVFPTAVALGSSSTLDAYQLTTPEPLFNGITEDDDPMGSTHYNALNISLERKIANVDFALNYIYSNWMDDDTYLNNSETSPPTTLWSGLDPNDRRQYFDAMVVWPLPIGQGHFLAGSAKGLLGGLINGWRVNTWVTDFTGAPLTLPDANLTGAPGCTSYLPVGGQTQAHMFNNNPNCYVALLPYQRQTTPEWVGYLREPGLFLMNLELKKRFKLPREGMYLEAIVDGDHLTNHPYFSNQTANTTISEPPTNEPQIGWTGLGTYTQTPAGDPQAFIIALRWVF